MNISRTALTAIALMGALGLGACGTTTEVTSAPAAVTSTPAPVPVPVSTPTPTQTSVFALRVGEPAQLTTDDVPKGTITVVSVQGTTKNPSTYDKAGPKNGMFWIVAVRYEAAATLTGTWSTNPFDWEISDTDGTRYSPEFSGEKSLGAVELKAGQKNSGTVVFDAPPTGSELFFQGSGSSASIASMPLTK